MLDIRPIGIEDYAERCSKPLSELHDKLWVETYAKTHSPGMTLGCSGGVYFAMSPDVHDRLLGVISHLPHVLVYALVNALECAPLPGVDLKKYCAGGFKDFTRIASSRPELWRDICLMNRRALGRSLTDYIRDLSRLNGWIRDGKGALLEKEFARAYELRQSIPD